MIQYLFFSDWLMHSTLQAHPCSHKGKTSFFFMAAWYSIVLLYHSLLIHSSTEGRLGCFQILAIVNNAAGEEFFLYATAFICARGSQPYWKLYGNLWIKYYFQSLLCEILMYWFTLTYLIRISIYMGLGMYFCNCLGDFEA